IDGFTYLAPSPITLAQVEPGVRIGSSRHVREVDGDESAVAKNGLAGVWRGRRAFDEDPGLPVKHQTLQDVPPLLIAPLPCLPKVKPQSESEPFVDALTGIAQGPPGLRGLT